QRVAPGHAFEIAGNGNSLGLRVTPAEQGDEGRERRRRQGDAGVEDRIADDVAELPVEVEAGAARSHLPARAKGTARFEEGQHLARLGVDGEGHASPRAANREPG